jgi:hypothetical protein
MEGVVQETKEKESYLFRFLDHRDHLVDAKTESCLDDADANTRGKHRAGFRAIEVWKDDRFVGRWERREG